MSMMDFTQTNTIEVEINNIIEARDTENAISVFVQSLESLSSEEKQQALENVNTAIQNVTRTAMASQNRQAILVLNKIQTVLKINDIIKASDTENAISVFVQSLESLSSEEKQQALENVNTAIQNVTRTAMASQNRQAILVLNKIQTVLKINDIIKASDTENAISVFFQSLESLSPEKKQQALENVNTAITNMRRTAMASQNRRAILVLNKIQTVSNEIRTKLSKSNPSKGDVDDESCIACKEAKWEDYQGECRAAEATECEGCEDPFSLDTIEKSEDAIVLSNRCYLRDSIKTHMKHDQVDTWGIEISDREDYYYDTNRNRYVRSDVVKELVRGEILSLIARDEKRLDVSRRNMRDDGTKILAELLKDNTVITALDLSSNEITANGVIELAKTVPTMRALEKLTMAKNGIIKEEAGKALADMLKHNSVLTELDISDCAGYTAGPDGAGFSKELANGLSTNGALVSANILFNNIGAEQAAALASILKEHPTLKSLCGNKGNETELNMAGKPGKPGKRMGADGAIMLAPEINANGALTSLDISNNNIGGKSPAVMKKGHGLKVGDKVEYEGVLRSVCGVGLGGYHVSLADGILALADAIKTNGALEKLLMSSNNVEGADAGKALGDAIAANTVLKELDLSGDASNYGIKGVEFMKEFAVGLAANGTLTSLNISSNYLGKLVSPVGWELKNDGFLGFFDSTWVHTSGRKQKIRPAQQPEGIIAIAEAIPKMEALTYLNISDNQIHYGDGAKAIASMLQNLTEKNLILFLNIHDPGKELDWDLMLSELKSGEVTSSHMQKMLRDTFGSSPEMNKVTLRTLDISGNQLHAEGIRKVVYALRDNKSLTSLDLSNTILHDTEETEKHMVVVPMKDILPSTNIRTLQWKDLKLIHDLKGVKNTQGIPIVINGITHDVDNTRSGGTRRSSRRLINTAAKRRSTSCNVRRHTTRSIRSGRQRIIRKKSQRIRLARRSSQPRSSRRRPRPRSSSRGRTNAASRRSKNVSNPSHFR